MTDNRNKKGDLEKLKKDYEALKAKYGLPDFAKLVEDFNGVERASDIETDYPIREIRRYVADKLFNYLRFIEALLNPSNVPMYVFSMVKTLGADDKKKLSDIYKELAKIEIKVMELDLDFAEQKEAEFIKDSYKLWQNVKKNISAVVETIKKNWDIKSEEEKRDYFG
ncbi:MAG: hypothetical protein AABY15_01250 [Nanoarchaeota archaeon]